MVSPMWMTFERPPSRTSRGSNGSNHSRRPAVCSISACASFQTSGDDDGIWRPGEWKTICRFFACETCSIQLLKNQDVLCCKTYVVLSTKICHLKSIEWWENHMIVYKIMHWGIKGNPPVPHFQTNRFWLQQWKRGVEPRIGIIRTSALMNRTDAFSTWPTDVATLLGNQKRLLRWEPEEMLTKTCLTWTTAVVSDMNFQGCRIKESFTVRFHHVPESAYRCGR